MNNNLSGFNLINELTKIYTQIKEKQDNVFLDGNLTVDYNKTEMVIHYDRHDYVFNYDYFKNLSALDFAYILRDGDAPYYNNVARKRKFKRLIASPLYHTFFNPLEKEKFKVTQEVNREYELQYDDGYFDYIPAVDFDQFVDDNNIEMIASRLKR